MRLLLYGSLGATGTQGQPPGGPSASRAKVEKSWR
jgi:hypothetical protein